MEPIGAKDGIVERFMPRCSPAGRARYAEPLGGNRSAPLNHPFAPALDVGLTAVPGAASDARRAVPASPSACALLLHAGGDGTGRLGTRLHGPQPVSGRARSSAAAIGGRPSRCARGRWRARSRRERGRRILLLDPLRNGRGCRGRRRLERGRWSRRRRSGRSGVSPMIGVVVSAGESERGLGARSVAESAGSRRA